MKEHLQTIINACFVISITAFIYQNNAQQDRIEALENADSADSEWQLSEVELKELIFDLSVLQATVAKHHENFEKQSKYNK